MFVMAKGCSQWERRQMGGGLKFSASTRASLSSWQSFALKHVGDQVQKVLRRNSKGRDHRPSRWQFV